MFSAVPGRNLYFRKSNVMLSKAVEKFTQVFIKQDSAFLVDRDDIPIYGIYKNLKVLTKVSSSNNHRIFLFLLADSYAQKFSFFH